VLQQQTVTHQEKVASLALATQDFGMEAAPQAPFLICPEVVMPGLRRL
jgi:hypothetical protein